MEVCGKEVRRMAKRRKGSDSKSDRIRQKNKRGDIESGIKLTALRSQTGGRHQKSPASFRGDFGRSSVVRESEFKSEDPMFYPQVGERGGEAVFLSLRVNSYAQTRLCLTPPFECTARTQICARVKDPIYICRKRVGLAADGIGTQKYCIHQASH